MQQTDYDVVCIGGCSQDVHARTREVATITVADDGDEEAYLGLPLGGKLDVANAQRLVGGGAANIAVGFARSGFKVGIVARIGQDAEGGHAARELAAQGVDCRSLIRVDGTTALSIVLHVQGGERTILIFRGAQDTWTAADLPWDSLGTARSLFLASLGRAGFDVLHDVAAFAVDKGIPLAANLGSAALARGVGGVGDVLAAADLLFLNVEEAERLTGVETRPPVSGWMPDLRPVLRRLRSFFEGAEAGKRVVVVTGGRRGAACWDGRHIHVISSVRGKVVDTLGAGDGFASAFTAAVRRGHGYDDALRRGAITAASVVAHVGGWPGLLDEDALAAVLAHRRGSMDVGTYVFAP